MNIFEFTGAVFGGALLTGLVGSLAGLGGRDDHHAGVHSVLGVDMQ